MSVLESINAHRKQDVIQQKLMVSIDQLKASEYYNRDCYSLSDALQSTPPVAVIAEHKRASPSEGLYGCPAKLSEVVKGYEASGVAAMSILTEPHHFGGDLAHLQEARMLTQLPLLRKDFILDPYQIHEAKSAGADAVLLIAASLRFQQALDLSNLAQDLGLQVLLELHDVSELEYLQIKPNVVGINNRNLKTLKIDLQCSIDLYRQLPSDLTKISESGIKNEHDATRILSNGYDGLLIGTQFMKTSNPGKACSTFIQSATQLLNQNISSL